MTQRDGQHVALVTGAGSGIGRASAVAFGRRGDAVVACDIDDDAGAETAELITRQGGTACYVRADVTDEADVRGLIEFTVRRHGRLDCAHNNAGHGGSPALLVDYPRTEWDRLLLLNLTSIWLCLKHEIPQMIRQGGGSVVNTASTFGLAGVAGMCAYVAGKHGVVGLTKAAAIEYAHAGIRVNAELTGGDIGAAEAQYVAREPIGRLGTPDEIAEAVIWLCSDAASFVTGHPLVADGGWLAQ
jgi:NAD(P)-dependent dehydrogenase (short-subunit alcohol dehydrogenase family)